MCESCKLLPSAVDHCPCGKTLLVELTNGKRESCLDPVPTCDNVCEKDLPCGLEGKLFGGCLAQSVVFMSIGRFGQINKYIEAVIYLVNLTNLGSMS